MLPVPAFVVSPCVVSRVTPSLFLFFSVLSSKDHWKKLQQLLVELPESSGKLQRGSGAQATKRNHDAGALGYHYETPVQTCVVGELAISARIPRPSKQRFQRMIEDGETSSLLVAQKTDGTHGMFIEELDRIKDKHQYILRLERSMTDLLQMFNEMAVLVESQGDMIDNIQMHVQNTVKYAAEAPPG